MDKRTVGVLLMAGATIYLLWPRSASAAMLPLAPTGSGEPPKPTPPGPVAAPSAYKPATSSIASSLPVLRRGSTGDAVKKWQSYIMVTADGKFGSGTEAATKAWQTKMGLKADGVVGPASWAMATAGAKTETKQKAATVLAMANAQQMMVDEASSASRKTAYSSSEPATTDYAQAFGYGPTNKA